MSYISLGYIFVADSMDLASASMTWLALKPTAYGGKHHKMAITPLKVIQGRRFRYRSKATCDFLLVSHTNVHRILYRFRYIANYWSNWPDGRTDGRTNEITRNKAVRAIVLRTTNIIYTYTICAPVVLVSILMYISGYSCFMHFKPHRTHEMRTIATDVLVAWCVCRPAKLAERMEVRIGIKTSGDQKNTLLEGGFDFPATSMRPSPNYFGHLFVLGYICVDGFVQLFVSLSVPVQMTAKKDRLHSLQGA